MTLYLRRAQKQGQHQSVLRREWLRIRYEAEFNYMAEYTSRRIKLHEVIANCTPHRWLRYLGGAVSATTTVLWE